MSVAFVFTLLLTAGGAALAVLTLTGLVAVLVPRPRRTVRTGG